MCFVGQQLVFEEACTVVNSLTGSCFNAKQIERVCHLYGGMLEQETSENLMQENFLEHKEQAREALHYVMVDGAMYPTREKGEPWREVKLGRVIKADQILSLCKDRNFIDKAVRI